jgi:hypothetical protein
MCVDIWTFECWPTKCDEILREEVGERINDLLQCSQQLAASKYIKRLHQMTQRRARLRAARHRCRTNFCLRSVASGHLYDNVLKITIPSATKHEVVTPNFGCGES